MKNNLIKLSFAIVLGAMLVACEPSNPEKKHEGAVGPVQVSRENIYECQPTTFACDYTASKDVKNIETSYQFTKDGEVDGSILADFCEVKNGQLVAQFGTIPSGNYQITLYLKEIFENDSKVITASKDFTVGGQPDVLNSMWFSSKQICRTDISFYFWSDEVKENQAGSLTFTEMDKYYEVWSAGSGKIIFGEPWNSVNLGGKRLVEYQFNENNKSGLTSVKYTKTDMKDVTKAIKELTKRMNLLKDAPFYGNGVEWTVDVARRSTTTIVGPTDEEIALATQFEKDVEAGLAGKDDANGTLAKAIQRGAIDLTVINMGSGKHMKLEIIRNKEAGATVPMIITTFSNDMRVSASQPEGN